MSVKIYEVPTSSDVRKIKEVSVVSESVSGKSESAPVCELKSVPVFADASATIYDTYVDAELAKKVAKPL